MAADFELNLRDFLEYFPPPQVGKITRCSGRWREDLVNAGMSVESGSMLRFHKPVNSNVTLSFEDSAWGGGNLIKITLPLDFPARFVVLPFDPVTEDKSPDHTYHTVGELIRSFPQYVQTNRAYNSPFYPNAVFGNGEVLKLLRLAFKNGQKMLECRTLESTRIMHLPLDCIGDFTVVQDHHAYLLVDLFGMLCRKRRIQIVDSKHRIPGLPAGFNRDLYLEEPEAYVEASPLNGPNIVAGLSHYVDIMVSPEKSATEKGILLNTFATNNRNALPLVARVTDWDEETTILENHYVKPGVEIVIHGWTRQSKVLARIGDKFCAIPLTYQGKFRLKQKQYHGVAALERAYPGNKVRVVKTDANESVSPIAINDILRVRQPSRGEWHAEEGSSRGHRLVKCDKLEAGRADREIRLPITSQAVFEEVSEDKDNEFVIKELVTLLTDEETLVELIEASPDQLHTERDLPLGQPIVLCDFIIEPAVYVSLETPDTPAFHVPLRTLIYVTFVQHLEKRFSPLLTRQSPKLSTLDRCVESLPPEVFESLHPNEEERINDILADENDFGVEAVVQPPAHRVAMPTNWTTAQVQKPGFSWSSRKNPLANGNGVHAVSEAEYDARSNGFAAKIKDRFGRKNKSTENLVQGSNYERHALSLPRNPATASENFSLKSHQAALQDAQVRQLVSTKDLMQQAVTAPGVAKAHSVAHVSNGGTLKQSNGYVLMPVKKERPVVPQGYMLVPVQQMPQKRIVQQHLTQKPIYVTRARSTAGSLTAEGLHRRVIEDFGDEDARSATLSLKQGFAIPRDGNLYHLSVRKMTEFLRHLRVNEASVRAFAMDKIDGRKFSKMNEFDLERYGLLDPVILHFRQQTTKQNANFML